jgi:hypothetical protein
MGYAKSKVSATQWITTLDFVGALSRPCFAVASSTPPSPICALRRQSRVLNFDSSNQLWSLIFQLTRLVSARITFGYGSVPIQSRSA